MKKVIGIFAALMVALSMTGVAYACWQETLIVRGVVNTGTVDIEWSEHSSWDTDDVIVNGRSKDVSNISCVINDSNPNRLDVTVTNAYPCIDYYNLVDIHNIGTIPVHLYELILSEYSEDITVDVSYRKYPLAAEGQPSLELPVQLHPCEQIYALIHVHVEQSAREGATYRFSGEIVAVQWNMTPEV